MYKIYDISKILSRFLPASKSCDRNKFKTAMSFYSEYIWKLPFEERIYAIDFILDMLKTELQTEFITGLFYSDKKEKTSLMAESFFPVLIKTSERKFITVETDEKIEVDFSRDFIFSRPWRGDRLINSVLMLKNKAFEYDKLNHFGYFFKEMKFGVITNGNHSTTSGIYHKKGKVMLDLYDDSRLFPFLKTDGEHYIKDTANGLETEKVCDYRVALIFELSKLKY